MKLLLKTHFIGHSKCWCFFWIIIIYLSYDVFDKTVSQYISIFHFNFKEKGIYQNCFFLDFSVIKDF